MLTPYRRHLAACPHRSKGAHFTLCDCPIWVYGELPTGTRVRRSLQTTDWTRAEHLIDKLPDQEEAARPALTLHQALAAYTADLRGRGLAPPTLKIYAVLFDHLRGAVPATTPLTAVDTATLERFRAARRRILPDGTQRPLQPTTQCKEISYLRAFFTWCVEHRYLDRSPAKTLRMPRVAPLITKPYEAHEVAALIQACADITSDDPARIDDVRRRALAIVLVLLYSGLRISDLCRLRREALNQQTGHLTLRATQKTGAPVRVKLHPDAVRALNRVPAIHPSYYFWTGKGSWNTLRNNTTRTIYRVGKLAGVAAAPHRFRDTFAVALLTGGATLRAVQLLLGHQSIRVTERHYAHFVADHQRLLDQAADALDFGTLQARPAIVKVPVRKKA